MDVDVVSPYSKISMTAATGLETKEQPTYTTVGSIYNPNAATPIQPPTRRPRTRRYPQSLESPSGEAFNFPDPFTALLLKYKLPPPPTTANTLRRYSPLQQNYDRALSPINEQEYSVLANFGMAVPPTIRSGNLPPPSVLENDDSVAPEDTLVSSRIRVKGLTNLASYPNPMRKAAQKALARARPANFAFSRPEGLSSLSMAAPDFGTGRDRPAVATPRLPSTSSSGTPQPLTAGPPGLRQLKRTTFDPAQPSIRTSRLEDQNEPPTASSHLPIGYQARSSSVIQPYKAETNYLAFNDRELRGRYVGHSTQLFQHNMSGNYGSIAQKSRVSPDWRHSSSSTPFQFNGPEQEPVKRFVYDTLPFERISKYFPKGLPPNYHGQNILVSDDWASRAMIASQQPPLQRQLDMPFYAGEGFSIGHLQRKLGAIGVERERRFGSGTDKSVPPKLSIEEAINMEASEHVKPMLEMTYVALLNYRDTRRSRGPVSAWGPIFAEPDESLIDHSPDGNNSFFDDPRVEVPKKKKVTRFPRRLGY
ncbi:hypothetical protein B0T21DRAFT_293816 [Apiosordaria backusii]|uniref:Uncharacterized protein n=1 Tax=Apiosordaria backusii TaxID=314023 RepID=A0AA40AXI1_9PEZI|nr:hypothetical protein B0T21DRAFT_293816 [Apiosordaria backusii]